MRSRNRQRSIVLVGYRPPPINGMSVAFDEIVAYLSAASGLRLRVFDLASRRNGPAARMNRLLGALLCGVAVLHERPKTCYVIVSQSRAGFFRDLPVLLSARAVGANVICHVHGGAFDELFGRSTVLRTFVLWAYRRVDVLVVLDEAHAGEAARTAVGAVKVVANGVERWPDRRPRRTDKPLRCLYLSNLIPSKGYELCIEAVELLQGEGFDVTLDIAGAFTPDPGERSDRVHERIHELSLVLDRCEFVAYHGTVQATEKHALLADADVILLPTNYRNEGQPISILEGLAAGVVPVITPHRSLRRLVEASVAIEVSTRSADGVASAIKVALDAGPDLHGMAQRGQQYQRRFHDSNKTLTRLAELIVGESAPRPTATGDESDRYCPPDA